MSMTIASHGVYGEKNRERISVDSTYLFWGRKTLIFSPEHDIIMVSYQPLFFAPGGR